MLRAILLLILVIAVLAFFGYRLSIVREGAPASVGTSGTRSTGPGVDTSRARERGAEVGEKLGAAADRAETYLSEAGITAKIVSKIKLDDHVKNADIHVETGQGNVVTLTGTAPSEDVHQRAVSLARDTDGVTRVVDRIRVIR